MFLAFPWLPQRTRYNNLWPHDLTKDEYDVNGDGVPDDTDGDGTPDYLDND